MSDSGYELLARLFDETCAVRRALEWQQQFDQPMTLEQAAAYLGIHARTLYRKAVQENKVTYHTMGKGGRSLLRFRKRDLDAFLDANKYEAMP